MNDIVAVIEYLENEIRYTSFTLSPMLEGRKMDREQILKTAISCMRELQQYRALNERLKVIYGDCPELLEIVVKHLETHEGVDFPEPIFKARLLTDGEVDKWEEYKKIGTPEECREARKIQRCLQEHGSETHEEKG